MHRINLFERNELSLSLQAEHYKAEVNEEIERRRTEKKPVNPSVNAKRDMADELMQQGFTIDSICRILNISEDIFDYQ